MPSFIDAYIDYTDIEFSSYAYVGEARHRCHYVDATNGGADADAYLLEAEGGTVTILLYCGKSVEDQYREILDAMVETFILHD